MEIKKPHIKSIPYEDFKNNEYLEKMVQELNANGGKVWVVWTTSSIGEEAIRFGRLPLQQVVAASNLWQWVLPGTILPVLGSK